MEQEMAQAAPGDDRSADGDHDSVGDATVVVLDQLSAVWWRPIMMRTFAGPFKINLLFDAN
jgi:hypothetical protein